MGQRHRAIRFAILFVALEAGGSSAARAQKPRCTTATIPTSSGPVCGKTSTATIAGTVFTASAYLGIPYAVPPVGPLRWQQSTLFSGSAPLVATEYGNSCPQATVTATASTASGSGCTRGDRVLGPGQSEDCLYLNA